MLVTVAVLVIMMTILVQIFQAATGSVTAAQTYQQLDDQLRRIDGIIRADLEGVTARFTPPLDPAQNLGYFEYAENEFADIQGEDSDDYIRFTAKAPPGRPIHRADVGRLLTPGIVLQRQRDADHDHQRVCGDHLFPPQRQPVPPRPADRTRSGKRRSYRWPVIRIPAETYVYPVTFGGNPVNQTGVPVSWQGMNDLSARPAVTGRSASRYVLNSLWSPTCTDQPREPVRHASIFGRLPHRRSRIGGTSAGSPDFQLRLTVSPTTRTMTMSRISTRRYTLAFSIPTNPDLGTATIVSNSTAINLLGFPFVFPGAYSQSQDLPNNTHGYGLGWIHSPNPTAEDSAGNPYQFDGNNPLGYLQNINHNPLDLGDNLPRPAQSFQGMKATSDWQTWWGFPTWRETLAPGWNDPTIQPNQGSEPAQRTQPFDLGRGKSGLRQHERQDPDVTPPDDLQLASQSAALHRRAGARMNFSTNCDQLWV